MFHGETIKDFQNRAIHRDAGAQDQRISGHFQPPRPSEHIMELTPHEKVMSRAYIGTDDIYLNFDSIDSIETDLSTGKYNWNVREKRNNEIVTNVYLFEIQSFTIPVPIYDDSYQPHPFYEGRVYMRVDVGGNRPIFGQGFTFEFDVEINGNRAILTPKNTEFIFTIPLRDMDVFRIQLFTPTMPVSKQPDVVSATSGPGTLMTTNELHGVPIGNQVAVIVSNFNSVDAEFNAIVNAASGHIVEATSNTTLDFVNTPSSAKFGTVLDKNEMPPTANILILDHRFAFQLRMRAIKPYITNYINP